MVEPNRIKYFCKGPDVYYTLTWTPLQLADKYQIVSSVPSVPGIYELFWKDESSRLHRLGLDAAWFGGLRNTIREKTDHILEDNAKKAKILSEFPIYYRYVLCDSWKIIQDVMFYKLSVYPRLKESLQSSNRYRKIFLNEGES